MISHAFSVPAKKPLMPSFSAYPGMAATLITAAQGTARQAPDKDPSAAQVKGSTCSKSTQKVLSQAPSQVAKKHPIKASDQKYLGENLSYPGTLKAVTPKVCTHARHQQAVTLYPHTLKIPYTPRIAARAAGLPTLGRSCAFIPGTLTLKERLFDPGAPAIIYFTA